MELRIKRLACTFDGLHAVLCQELDKFLVNQLHALTDSCGVVAFGARFEAALEIVDNRQKTFEDTLGGILDEVGFFFDSTFAEIVKLGHQEEIFLLLFFHLRLSINELLFQSVDVGEFVVDDFVLFVNLGVLLFLSFLNVIENFGALCLAMKTSFVVAS